VSASWSGYAGDRELLHAVLSSFPQSVFFKDLQGRYLRVSSFMASCFGREEANDMVGLTDFDLLPIDYARQSFEVEQHIIKTREPVRNKEQQLTYPNGQFAWISVSKFPLCDREGNLVGTFGVALDITARKKEEEQRREMELQMQLSQKLESIGRLASGVAHEINTPAQFITDNTQFLQKAVTPLLATLVEYRNLRDAIRSGHAVQEALDKVDAQEAGSRLDFFAREIPATLHDTLEGLARVTKIVRSLKEFSHPNKTTKSLVDLNRAIETTLSLSRHEWKYVAEARTELQPDLPMIPCVFDEINQVILNLIVNAAHAIADERKSKQDVALGLITIRTRLDGPNALIEVSDTGTGIADDVKSHLFEPFFTTKEVGRGTGQGLAIIRTVIVKNHGGAIFFTTELGKGTTFTISLPLA
jgi:PAS domain S-box-containing protein